MEMIEKQQRKHLFESNQSVQQIPNQRKCLKIMQ